MKCYLSISVPKTINKTPVNIPKSASPFRLRFLSPKKMAPDTKAITTLVLLKTDNTAIREPSVDSA